MICSKNPEQVMKEIESVDLVKDSSKGPPAYYLGNDYTRRIRREGGALGARHI